MTSSTQGIKTVLHPVSDLAASKAVYTALLGIPPQADAPYYVGYDAEGQHIGLVPRGGPQTMASPVPYWHVADIEAKLAEVTAAGATVKEPPRDVGGGRLVATFTDPDGNVLGLLQDPERGPGPGPQLSTLVTPTLSRVAASAIISTSTMRSPTMLKPKTAIGFPRALTTAP